MILAKLAGFLLIGLSVTIIYLVLGILGLFKFPEDLINEANLPYELPIKFSKHRKGFITVIGLIVLFFIIGCIPFILPTNNPS